MTKLLICLAILAGPLSAQLDQKTNRENMVRDRGQTPVFQTSDWLTLSGTLIDASCKDRSMVNLAAPPESLAGATPAAQAKAGRGGVSAHGISVDAKTLSAERADVLEHQVPDLRTRQADPTCALTGGTSAYAVLLDDGRLLNLDAGGNTLASEAVQLSEKGRAMLNGTAYGFKPRVKITGRIRGDRVLVRNLGVT